MEPQSSRVKLTLQSVEWVKANQTSFLDLAVEVVRETHKRYKIAITEEDIQLMAQRTFNDMLDRFDSKKLNTAELKGTFLHILQVRGQLEFTAVGVEMLYNKWIAKVQTDLATNRALATAIVDKLNYVHSLLKAAMSFATIEYESRKIQKERTAR
jgi:hypothetical protein